jgi:hypothetical protein
VELGAEVKNASTAPRFLTAQCLIKYRDNFIFQENKEVSEFSKFDIALCEGS